MLSMRVPRFEASLFPSMASPKLFLPRRGLRVLNLNGKKFSESNVKRAKLSARKKERIKLSSYSVGGGGEKTYPIREFLSHPSGVEALLNKSALQSFEPLDCTTYRCILPQLSFLNFEVSPVINLRVTPTDEDCMVEMLSCKFEGSEVMERQNERFSALMTNYITWNTKDSEPYLDVDVKLDLALEVVKSALTILDDCCASFHPYTATVIYTQPFNVLPTSAVEVPGTLMMQALVDRLVPLLLQQLSRDYDRWVRQDAESNLMITNS